MRSLLYHCKKCLVSSTKHLNQCLSPNEGNEIINKIPSNTNAISILNKNIERISTQTNSVLSVIAVSSGQAVPVISKDVIFNVIASLASTNIALASQNKGQHQLSYADIVSSDFVESVISQAIKEQRKVDARDATIVV